MKRSLVAVTSLALILLARYAFAGASEAASGASTSQSLAGMASLVTSGVMTQQCASTKNPSTCTMAALSAAQALNLGQTSKGASESAAASSTNLSAVATTTPDTTDYGSLTGSTAKQNESTARSTLADEGYSLSADGSTLTTPSGSTISAASMAGDSGMQAAGMSAGQIAQAKAALADAQAAVAARVKNSGLAVGDGGGGGGGGGSGGKHSSGGAFSYSFAGPSRKGPPPNLSGMTKNFGGEKIGVSGDDIFEMITRRYKSQDNSNLFIKN